MMQAYLELTIIIGCPVKCARYCPQEIIAARYTGKNVMDYETFKHLILTVPTEIPLWFAGFSEPFANPDCIRMLEYAHEKGHDIRISSTLFGVTPDIATRIAKIPVSRFVLHLPDACGNSHIPVTDNYLKSLAIILTSVKNIEFMNMGGLFTSNNSEIIARNRKSIRIKHGRMMCHFMTDPAYQLLPNGNVYFCCMTRGLSEMVGSLNETSYQALVSQGRFEQEAWRMQNDPSSLCHVCSWSTPWWLYLLRRGGSKIFNTVSKVF